MPYQSSTSHFISLVFLCFHSNRNMAEALISVLLEQLASVTYQHVGDEVKLVLNAEKDVQEFEANLKVIGAVLEDAELRQVRDANVRNWLEQLKDVSYKMDNVVDEWKTEILKQQVEKQEEHGGSTSLVTDKKKKKAVCFSIPSSCFCFGQVGQVSRVILRHEIAHKIKSLNENLDVIVKQRETYNFRITERMISEQPKREKTSSFVDESIIFGRDQQKEVLVSKLLNESSQEERGLLVIPIVGMGGMGKTTLAQLAFNDENVKACFQIKIWICVSDPFDEIKIAKAIIEGVKKDTSPNSDELETFLQCMSKSIEGKKFLLVLDDVWTEDQGKWEKLKLPLIQSGAHGSRILVTTRKQKVADMMGAPTHTIYMERLSEQNCLSIFNRMAFYNRDKDSVLEAIGEEIAKKCKGLPLAAKTLGSLMRYKKTRKEWQEVLNSKIWDLEEVEQQVFQPLLLSYFDLAPAVKRCLLYCVIFPKDHLIYKDYLIELWMSQGYLYSKGNTEKEIIGQRCFDNLAMRSFFQDFEEDGDGNIRRCKMHDIVHDFLQYLTQHECFTMEVKGGNNTIKPLGDKIRHLTLMLAPRGPLSCVSFSSCDLRTLATFDSKFNVVDSTLIAQLKHLRTLNLSDNSIEVLPEETGKLVHLRFIDLSNNPLKKLPNGVCNLYNLQTLRLVGCRKLESLPQSMGKLINLKHLYVEGCDELKYLPKGIGRLTNLRRLDGCPVGGGKDDDEAFKLGDLRNLDQLQGALWIEIDGDVKVAAGEHEKASPLGNKQQLSGLSIEFEECGTAEILNFLRPHPNLESLGISGYNGSTAPNWIMSLNNLRILYLKHWGECEVLPPLGILPSLETLILSSMKGVKKVGVEFLGIEKETTSASSCITLFPKLKTLKLWYMEAWEEWKGVEEWKEEDSHITIMPCLSSLQIEYCPQLKTLPDFLRKTPLQTLDISDSWTLARGCQKGRGKEWPKISHIPNIKIIPGKRIVEAEDAVELPERASTSDSDDEGEGMVEAEDAVELPERPSTSGPEYKQCCLK
ncbi:putative disease resistance protein RGA4 isoform X2 [Malus sylvestris]|uniref:putative disease resistance protein RGA4 isoform X2 n=1 Tax=Malus sylvestris TaxID=3752 RepID=UPI0021ACCD91|nr:putative disease resistance protein RGA4 isoform X2 [Malus sylvestris]